MCLLEAELLSFEMKNEDAKAMYAAAISASCSSRFVHDQGLACELAAQHRLKINEVRASLDFFRQARECYSRWGSQIKVEYIAQQETKILNTFTALVSSGSASDVGKSSLGTV